MHTLMVTYDACWYDWGLWTNEQQQQKNSCQWTFCMFTTSKCNPTNELLLLWWCVLCSFYEFCTAVWWVARTDSMRCMGSMYSTAHIHGALSPMNRGSNAYVLASTAMPMTAAYNSGCCFLSSIHRPKPFGCYYRFCFFVLSFFILSNAKHIFHTSNACITFCLTFYSTAMFCLSFGCCCATHASVLRMSIACICVQSVLHAFRFCVFIHFELFKLDSFVARGAVCFWKIWGQQ